jgi:DNA-binding IclR family transcriptional regulator
MKAVPLNYESAGGRTDRMYVTALARGLQILRCFTHDRPELTPPEIVRLTGLPQPTVWRLCYTLSKEGFIVCAGDGHRMALGLPALSLGYGALVRQKLPELALPHMQALTDRHRLGLSLAVRDGTDMLYLQRTHGDFIQLNDPVGARRPLAVAPTGWACLAAYDDDERQAVCAALKRLDPDGWPETEARIASAAEDYRAHGVVLSTGVIHPELNAAAVPIRSVRRGRIYGLSASGPGRDWPREKLLTVSAELIALAESCALAAD